MNFFRRVFEEGLLPKVLPTDGNTRFVESFPVLS